MNDDPTISLDERPTRWKAFLLQLQFIGLIGFLGGLASLTALGLLGPLPVDLAGWQLLRAAMRSIFFPCLFAGVIITVLAGVLLLVRQPRAYLALRWFRLEIALLIIFVPTCHLWARGRVLAFDKALEAGRLEELPAHWRSIALALACGFAIFLLTAVIGRTKPRLRLSQ